MSPFCPRSFANVFLFSFCSTNTIRIKKGIFLLANTLMTSSTLSTSFQEVSFQWNFYRLLRGCLSQPYMRFGHAMLCHTIPCPAMRVVAMNSSEYVLAVRFSLIFLDFLFPYFPFRYDLFLWLFFFPLQKFFSTLSFPLFFSSFFLRRHVSTFSHEAPMIFFSMTLVSSFFCTQQSFA